MNLSLWTAIREYVAAEVRLSMYRHERLRHKGGAHYDVPPWDKEAAKLEAQATRMETAVREMLEG